MFSSLVSHYKKSFHFWICRLPVIQDPFQNGMLILTFFTSILWISLGLAARKSKLSGQIAKVNVRSSITVNQVASELSRTFCIIFIRRFHALAAVDLKRELLFNILMISYAIWSKWYPSYSKSYLYHNHWGNSIFWIVVLGFLWHCKLAEPSISLSVLNSWT